MSLPNAFGEYTLSMHLFDYFSIYLSTLCLHSFRLGMLFSSAISCSAILWQRVKKGNGDACPTLCDNDSRPNSALAHTISRGPHEKRRELLTADDVSLPLTLLPFSRNGGRRGMFMGIPSHGVRV